MTPHDVLAELRQLGITIEAHGDRLRYSPRSAMTPALLDRLTAHKPALIAALKGELRDYNEECWCSLSDKDRGYLRGSRNWPGPCPWCGGRLVHRKACQEMLNEWGPVIPYGKYRGQLASEVPANYLSWMAAQEYGGEDFQDRLQRWLKSRRE